MRIRRFTVALLFSFVALVAYLTRCMCLQRDCAANRSVFCGHAERAARLASYTTLAAISGASSIALDGVSTAAPVVGNAIASVGLFVWNELSSFQAQLQRDWKKIEERGSIAIASWVCNTLDQFDTPFYRSISSFVCGKKPAYRIPRPPAPVSNNLDDRRVETMKLHGDVMQAWRLQTELRDKLENEDAKKVAHSMQESLGVILNGYDNILSDIEETLIACVSHAVAGLHSIDLILHAFQQLDQKLFEEASSELVLTIAKIDAPLEVLESRMKDRKARIMTGVATFRAHEFELQRIADSMWFKSFRKDGKLLLNVQLQERENADLLNRIEKYLEASRMHLASYRADLQIILGSKLGSDNFSNEMSDYFARGHLWRDNMAEWYNDLVLFFKPLQSLLEGLTVKRS